MFKRLLFVLCLFVFAICGSYAQTLPGNIVISVTPKNATVAVDGATKVKTEYLEGQDVSVHHFKANYGSYSAELSAPGFSPLKITFSLSASDRTFEPELVSLSPLPTTGTLSVSVSPKTASVTVLGPDNFSISFVGDRVLTQLKPGNYSLAASASG